MQIKNKKIMIKDYYYILIIAALVITSCDGTGSEKADQVESDSLQTEEEVAEKAKIASPRKKAEGTIEGVKVTVDYGSPGVKDRKIWGGLEEWGVVWRAGANETTSIEFGSDVNIDGTKVSAGKYGVYMIPNENGDWTFILNTDWSREKHGSWGAYNYSEANDVLRVDLEPKWVEENQERLQYEMKEGGIAFAWEKARLFIPISKG